MNNINELHEALARVVLAETAPTEVQSEIKGIARRAMPAVEAASVTLIRGDRPFTAAYDGQMALDADELQYEPDRRQDCDTDDQDRSPAPGG